MGGKGIVCVTGAGGYVASWLVKLLLSNNYTVHATVRNPDDAKNSHLKKLEESSDRLKLFKADLLNYDSILMAVKGCNGVFHVASPVPSSSVPNPEVEIVEPAVKGTLNVLKACLEAGVNRVVYVSSGAAIMLNPSWPSGKVKDESCWSDKEYCKATNNWYCYSKTEAESEAWEFAKKNGINLVTVCPNMVWGPMLQSTTNASSMALVKLLKEKCEQLENKMRLVVDVRDVAESLLMVYEKPEAEGRYICTAHTVSTQDLVEMLKRLYPDHEYPKSFTGAAVGVNTSSEKLQTLGWSFRPLEETISDSIESYKQAGILE
ncbi:hypothetical protein ACET3Z_017568 [Daucus carota]